MQRLRSEEEMEQARQWEEVLEEEVEEVGLRKTKSQHRTAAAAAVTTIDNATVEFGGVKIEGDVVFEESIDVKENGRGVINFGDPESDAGFDVTTKFTDIQKSLSTVINHHNGANIRDENFPLSLPTFDENNPSDERLDVTAKITDILKSASAVINHQNGENIREESLPLSLPTFDENNPSDERLDVTAKITDIQKSASAVINHQNGESIRDESLPLNLPTFHESYEDQITRFKPSETEIIEHASVDLIKKTYEETEFELGRLLEEPNSHKFYCPNCNACIEKIILLRREQERLLAAIKELEPRAPIETTFTCTSCYSFLVFIGNQLISIFTPRRKEPKGSERPRTEESDVEALVPSQGLVISLPDQSRQPPSDQNAALSILPLDNGGLDHDWTPALTEVGKDILDESSLAINVRERSENEIRNKTANGHTQYVEENGVATKDQLHSLDRVLFDQNDQVSFTKNASTSGHAFGIAIGTTTYLTAGSSLPKEVKVDIREKGDDKMEVNNEDKNNTQEAEFHKESIIDIEENDGKEETFHEGYADETKGKGLTEPGDSQNAQDVRGSETIMETKRAKPWGILKGVVNVGLTKSITSPTIVPSPVAVTGSSEPISSPTTQVTSVPAAPASTISGPENSKKWDILKSIVYGGLVESITSLGIVASAAGADATTLHILALAFANLIGGLFVIGHNLMELRNEQPGESNSQTRIETDRYYRQLGERENFKLHATLVVLSFLLFGLVAPVTYGFSFLKSDDKDLKLVAVAAASLLCIALLAIGKAYIQKASNFFGYFKTILYYVIAGFMASGISYVAGELIKKLLEKLGLFESSAAAASTLSLPGNALVKPGWEYY